METIKTTVLIMFISALLFMTESCKVGVCPDKNCNIGTLNEDNCVCECPVGYSGDNCEDEDVCHEANANQEWGYDHFGGPDCWSAVCGHGDCLGDAQSPINIKDAVTSTTLPALFFNPSITTTEVINNGHTLQFAQQPGSFVDYGMINGFPHSFTLGQFHFHSQSEHQVDGNHSLLEAHLVFRSIWENNYLVVSVMFEVGTSNAFLENFVAHLPANVDDTYTDVGLTYNPFDILPANKSHFRYTGSLTTPPCSEIVTWIVMENRVKATQAQIDGFTAIMGENYRPVQALNSRIINHHVE